MTEHKGRNYVAPVRVAEPIKIPVYGEILEASAEAQPIATMQTVVKTSQVDRSLGFLLASTPAYLAFSGAVVGIVKVGWGIPVFSVAALVLALLAFLLAWICGYTYNLKYSPEGIALNESNRKWDLWTMVYLDHREEWRRQNGLD